MSCCLLLRMHLFALNLVVVLAGANVPSTCEKDSSGSDDADVEQLRVSLVQRNLNLGRMNFSALVRQTDVRAASRQEAPLTYVHIEKTGSIRTAVFGLPGVCLEPVDKVEKAMKNISLTWSSDCEGAMNTSSGCNGDPDMSANVIQRQVALQKFLIENCPGITVLSETFLAGDNKHWSGMGDVALYPLYYEDRALAMFRQPEQRIISGFNNNYHSWREVKVLPPTSLLEYAIFIQGCQAKMLIGTGYPCLTGVPPTDAETALAVARVRQFAFVGITAQWDLSMCLMHAMFGGRCTAAELLQTHSTSNSTSEYDISELHGWVDVPDNLVYDEVLRVFKERLQQYNVTPNSCQASCFDTAQ